MNEELRLGSGYWEPYDRELFDSVMSVTKSKTPEEAREVIHHSTAIAVLIDDDFLGNTRMVLDQILGNRDYYY